jgi:hypothetical protein
VAGCAGAARRPPPVLVPAPLPEATATRDVARLVGWGDDRVTVAAAAWWRPDDGAPSVQASVLVRAVGDRRELLLALVDSDRLVGKVPLATAEVRGRSLGASLAELPLGRGERVLRVDLTSFELGGSGRFATKAVLVAAGGHKILERIVESGDRVRDRRARIEAREPDTLVAEERQSGDPETHTVVYRRGADGRFVTRDRSIFDE